MRRAKTERVIEEIKFKLRVKEYSVQKGDFEYENNMEDGSVSVV